MPSIQPSADYTDRDLASIRTRFLGLIASVFPTWTDLERSNFGNIMLDLFAWTGDILSFTQDANAREAFAVTAVQRRSLLKAAQWLGYVPVGASAASTVETFTATGLVANCIIAAGTKIKTLSALDAIEFQTLSPITLTVGAPSASVTVENSVSESESFASTALPDLSITLGKTPYLDGSLTITTPQGLFTEVVSFVNSEPADKVFVVKVDNNDRAAVQFGDGVTAGVIPTGLIVASYKTGGGARGNAAAHSIQAIENAIQDVLGNPVSLTCDNAAAATGGSDRESAASIQQSAPQSIREPKTTTARRAFEVNAMKVPGVLRALALTQNEDGDVPTNAVHLYIIVAPGFSVPMVLDRVRRQFITDDDTAPFPMMATQTLRVEPAPFVDIDVVANVYRKRNTIPAVVGDAIRASLASFLDITSEQIDFAYYLRRESAATTPTGLLPVSDVVNAIRDTVGVRMVGPNLVDLTLGPTRKVYDAASGTYLASITNPFTMVSVPTWTRAPVRQDVVLDFSDGLGPPASANFPRLGTVTLVDGDTGLPL